MAKALSTDLWLIGGWAGKGPVVEGGEGGRGGGGGGRGVKQQINCITRSSHTPADRAGLVNKTL